MTIAIAIDRGVTAQAGHELAAFCVRDAVLREQVRSDFPVHVQQGEGTDLLMLPDGLDVLYHRPEHMR